MSVLIKNGIIYSGKGEKPFKKDVLIRNSLITRIASNVYQKTDNKIEASELLVVPGFIDTNSFSEKFFDILLNPEQEKNIKNGITTAIGGNQGFSLAPLFKKIPEEIIYPQSVSKVSNINIDWHSFSEFLTALKKRGVGINFGSLVGVSTVQNGIFDEKDKKISPKNFKVLEKIIENSLKEGALGISFNKNHNFKKNQINKLLKLAGKYNAVATFAPEIFEDNQKEYKDILKATKKMGTSVEFSELQSQKNLKNLGANFDCYPYNFTLVSVRDLFPLKYRLQPVQKLRGEIKTNKFKKSLSRHFRSLSKKKITIFKVPEELNFLEGKTIKEFSENHGLSKTDALIRIAELSDFRAFLLFHNIKEKDIKHSLKSEFSSVGSDGIHIINERYSPFMDFIKKSVEDFQVPMEKVINKITKEPAKIFNIKNRGEIKESFYADILIINKETFEIEYVLVNGHIVLSKGVFQKKKKKGKIIKK